jgi:ABC-type multidrug transport system fused ATPase/permease subunit
MLRATAPSTSPAYRSVLATYLRPLRWRLALLGLLMLADISLDLIGPRIQRAFIDGALEGSPLPALLRLAGLYLGMAFVLQALFVASTLVATDIAQRATNHLREDLLAHVLRLDLRFHDRRTPGELIERIDGDVATLANFLSRFMLELVGSVLLLSGVLVLLFRIDVRIGLVLTLFALLAFFAMRALLSRSAARWEATREASAGLFGFLEERLAGLEDIRASGAAGYTLRGLLLQARIVWRAHLRAALFGSITGSTSIFLIAVGSALSLGLGILLYQEGAITIGTVFLIFSYSQILRGPIDGIARQMEDLQRAGGSIARIGALLAEPTAEGRPEGEGEGEGAGAGAKAKAETKVTGRMRKGAQEAVPTAGAPAVALENVTFGYDRAQPVLREVSLHVPAGGSLGLLGRTGSGKSTIARLLLRLYDPDAGAITLDGRDLRDLPHAAVRTRVAMVTQQVQLFEASLRDNLTLFDDDVPEGRLREALEGLGLGRWLASLPAGLETQLAADGEGLSAGEAQLVALGRVMLRDPGVVILDEASSRLDPVTERRIERALARLAEGRTSIVIAHRLSTVRRVDRVAILARGEVVEQGERAALAADRGSRFAGLLATGIEEIEAAVAEVVLDAEGNPT